MTIRLPNGFEVKEAQELVAKQSVVVPPENPCAFPVAAVYDAVREQVNASSDYGCDAGMSLRDYFASRAPQMTDQWWSDSSGEHWVDAQASFAYAYADAMLKARLK